MSGMPSAGAVQLCPTASQAAGDGVAVWVGVGTGPLGPAGVTSPPGPDGGAHAGSIAPRKKAASPSVKALPKRRPAIFL
jgi:hypothetical protein